MNGVSEGGMTVILMAGLTAVAFMTAMNAQGRVRGVISWVLSVILLATTVTIFFTNSGSRPDRSATQVLQTLEPGEPAGQQSIGKGQILVRGSGGRISAESRRAMRNLRSVVSEGLDLSNSLLSRQLQDESVELETLKGRAGDALRRVETIRLQMLQFSSSDPHFSQSLSLIREGVRFLGEAARSYHQYYYSEDSEQEKSRELVLRQKSKAAQGRFQKAAGMLASLDRPAVPR